MEPVAPTRRAILGTVAALGTFPLTSPSGEAASARPAALPASPRTAADLLINGEHMALSLEPSTTLLDALREQTALAGTKKGRDHGSRGACTVHCQHRRLSRSGERRCARYRDCRCGFARPRDGIARYQGDRRTSDGGSRGRDRQRGISRDWDAGARAAHPTR